MNRNQNAARAVAEAAARAAYGRLLAYVAMRTRDIALAEDALAEAFAQALQRWPADGIPDRPEAWLLTVARRRLANGWRRQRVADAAAPMLRMIADEAEADMHRRDADAALPDERLRLLFICAHPAIDAGVRTPLMLQTVLGLDAARIAAAFAVAPAAMGQRLVRAKAKIRDAGIGFATPAAEDLPDRLGAVLEAIYAAYASDFDVAGATDLSAEAIFLARLVAELLPGTAEARALAALLLLIDARRAARHDADGRYVPLSAQDMTLWSAPLIAEAEAHLHAAAALRTPGRFQIEAAIQSAHAWRRVSGDTPWPAIVRLYDRLVEIAPTLGAAVARAAAIGAAHGPDAGLAALDALAAAQFQPWWATRAALAADAGRPDMARASYDRALALTRDAAVRAFLVQQRQRLG